MKVPGKLTFSAQSGWVLACNPTGDVVFMARVDNAFAYAECLRKQAGFMRDLDPTAQIPAPVQKFLDNAQEITRTAQIAKAGMAVSGPGPVPFIDKKFGIGRQANENSRDGRPAA